MARFLRTETNSSRGHSRLRPPVVVFPFIPETTRVTLAPSPRQGRKAKSSLPQLLPVNPPENYGGPRVKLVAPRSTNPPVRSRLRPPTVVTPGTAPFVARPIDTTLVRIRPFPTDASVFKPAVIDQAQGPQGGIGIQLVQPPRQARKTTSKLFGFVPKVTPPVLYPIGVTLAPQRRGTPKSILRAPAIQTYLAVPSQVVLFPLLGRVPAVHSKLRRPETPAQKPNAPLAVHLTYSRRGKPRSKLSPPAWTRSFGEIKTTFAPQRRGTPKSRLAPPAIQTYLPVPSLVSLFPLTNRVPAVKSKLSPPATLATPSVNIYDPIQGYLTRPLDRVPAVRSRLEPPAVVAQALVSYPISVTLAPARRPVAKSRLLPVPSAFQPVGLLRVHLAYSLRGKPKSRLKPPTVVGPVLARPIDVTLAPQKRGVPKSRLLPVPAAFQPVGEVKVTLAYSLRGKPKSKLQPPTVVFPFFARQTDITLVRIRPVPTTSFLRPPTDLVDAQDLGKVAVHLAYSLRGKPKSRLAPPTVVAPVLARKIEVTLAPQRRGTPKSRLFPPVDLVDQADVGYIRVHLAYSRRGAPKSILHPPVPPETFRGIQAHLAPSSRGKPRSFFVATPIAFQAVELSGPEVTLVRIRPPRTMWNLGPMGPPAVVYAPLSVNLTYSRRGAPRSFLPQASLYQPQPKAEYDLRITLAPQRRGKPKSFLRPPTRVNAATPYFRELPVTLAPQKRGKAKSFLRPPTVVRYFVARPALVSLAPSRFPVPKSRLRPPTDVVDLQDLGSIQVTLAPSRFPRPKSKLLGVIYAARVYAPIRVTLAPSRFPTPKSRLLPPAVVERAFIQINPTVQLVTIVPPRTHYRLRPPAVVGAGVYFRGIQVHLAYSVRGKPKSKLSYTAIAVEECYGHVVCGFDFAAVVCGTDDSPDVTGGDTSGSAVSGTDSSATVTGTSASSGSVSGGDERREGC